MLIQSGTSPVRYTGPTSGPSAPALVKAALTDGVLTITLSRPDRKNAITLAMYAALNRAFDHAEVDRRVHAVVVTGSPTVFTAGHDLADLARPESLANDSPLRGFIHRLIDMPKPLIAAVEGYAVGIGTTMLLHFDFVYAGGKATFRIPFGQLFVTPEAASTVLLPQSAGRLAAEVMMTGESFGVEKAIRLGLVNEVVEPGKALERALQRAAQLVDLARMSPNGILETKLLLRQPHAKELHAVADRELDVFAERLKSQETIEAINGLLKGKP